MGKENKCKKKKKEEALATCKSKGSDSSQKLDKSQQWWIERMPKADFRDAESICKSIICLVYLYMVMMYFRKNDVTLLNGISDSERSSLKKATSIVGKLPLLDRKHVTKRGRYPGNKPKEAFKEGNNTDIGLKDVRITDLKSINGYDHSLAESGFEVGKLGSFINLPQEEDYQTAPPATPWQSGDLPLHNFVRQFQWNTNSINLPNHFAIFFKCGGELLRGATSSGAATEGSARHPPTFNAHIDQDMSGSPLTEMYRGWLPYLFEKTELDLYNIWIPLNNETVRPLALMDERKVRLTTRLRCVEAMTWE